MMNRAYRLVSNENELGRGKEHIKTVLQVSRYPNWMLVDSCVTTSQTQCRRMGKKRKRGNRKRKK